LDSRVPAPAGGGGGGAGAVVESGGDFA
jgi:hypothetical protein